MDKSEYFPAKFYEKIYRDKLIEYYPIIDTVEVLEGANLTDYLLQITYPKTYKNFNSDYFCSAIAWNIKDLNNYLSIYPTLTIRVFMDDEFICATFVGE